MKLQEFINDDTCQILFAIIIGIVICYFIFGSSGSCNRDGFSVGAPTKTYTIDPNKLTERSVWTTDGQATLGTLRSCDPTSLTNAPNPNILDDIQNACCNEQATEDCEKGLPTICDPDCNTVMNEINTQCTGDTNFAKMDHVAWPTALSMCNRENPSGAGVGPSTVCNPNPCNTGTCSPDSSAVGTYYSCMCPIGYTGTNCEVPPAVQPTQIGCTDAISTCNNNGNVGISAFRGIGVSDLIQAGENDDYDCCSNIIQSNPDGWTSAPGKECGTLNENMSVNTYYAGCIVGPPPTGPTDQPQQPQPTTVTRADVEAVATGLVDTIAPVLSQNGFGDGDSRVNSIVEFQEIGIYPVTLHKGDATIYDPNVVYGNTTLNTIRLFNGLDGSNGSMESGSQTFGSIAQAVANVFKHKTVTQSGNQTAIQDEMTQFCGGGGTFGDPSVARIDPNAKIISDITFENASGNICGMPKVVDDSGDYRHAIDDIFSGSGFSQTYIYAIKNSYVDLAYPPVAITGRTDLIQTSVNINTNDSSGTPNILHTAITYNNGIPDYNGQILQGSSVTSQHLVIMDTGLSDTDLYSRVRGSGLDALDRIKDFQYYLSKERQNVHNFADPDDDPFSDYSCANGTCNARDHTQAITDSSNIPCAQAGAEVQSYSYVTVDLSKFEYLTPKKLDGMGYMITNGQLMNEVNKSIGPFAPIGNFFIWKEPRMGGNPDKQYITANNEMGSTDELTMALNSDDCLGQSVVNYNLACCQHISENVGLSLRDLPNHSDIHYRCRSVIGDAITPVPAPTGPGAVTPGPDTLPFVPPPAPTGGQKCNTYMINNPNTKCDDGHTTNRDTIFDSNSQDFNNICCSMTCPTGSSGSKSNTVLSNYVYNSDQLTIPGNICPDRDDDDAKCHAIREMPGFETSNPCCYCDNTI
jgi:hypothetical protein